MSCWIICILWWISYCESSRFENLRRNQDEDRCKSELVSSHLLLDEQFTGSSYLQGELKFQPSKARLLDIHSQSSPSDGLAWCPVTAVHKRLSEWIEVDFRRMTLLMALYTMGRGDGNFKKFSPEIVIKYQRSDLGSWFTYRDSLNQTIIPINTDSRTKLRTTLQTIVATKIRIYPLDTRHGPKLVCLKISFLGCYFEDEVVSYTAPQGDRAFAMNHTIDLRDEKYDGEKSNIVQRGLGVLMDNMALKGPVNMNDYIDPEMSKSFTGWKCSEERSKSPISITFYFKEERIFSDMSIYYVTDRNYNMMITSHMSISIGYDNHTYHSIINGDGARVLEYVVQISMNRIKGTICTLNITCGTDNWIILNEVEIKSTKSSVDIEAITSTHYLIATERSKTTLMSENGLKEISLKNWYILIMVIGLAVVLFTILLSCVAFLCYKMRLLRKHKLDKKLKFAVKCSKGNLCDPLARTTFTVHSKHPSVSAISRLGYFSESKPPMSNPYDGSQLSDGMYASWPNTDEEIEGSIVHKDEEKCFLVADLSNGKSTNKDYALYQPGINQTSYEYFHCARPSSTSNCGVSEPLPLYAADLAMAPSNYVLQSNQMSSYQHLINYRGICGDIDLRYQSIPTRPDQYGLDSDIKVLSTTSIIFVQPWIRGQFGWIDLVTIADDNNDKSRYFMKKMSDDSPLAVKSKFILDLKILSSLNISNIARLSAIVVDNDLLHGDMTALIRSARFSLLVENHAGYNLKEFLKNFFIQTQTQAHTLATLPSQSQISMSSMLSILNQISSGLRHLEELELTHRDVGCRNCIIDSRRQIKLYPGGYVTTPPFEDYCSFEVYNNQVSFPLRWMAPESLSKGLYTSKSDVWSFGVTIWEVLTLCSLRPYPSLSDEALLELMIERDKIPRLSCPQNCPREVYDIITGCCSLDQSTRPTFADINVFLQIKNTAATNIAQLILPAPPLDSC